ncbi:hypothetical protein OJF2_44270 [Aquisphaera giovannonii]|uniref:Uncharacterized protein n=1 Tax=Aquisphaera giovannonii TaxID=406548 RepID=A0A5B9W7G6_9BACT|nr:hypothetical protein [Aquisphaera giovannonii]QEH35870.1 hypothetical protein OJF2_44270 [Aquisphaera giovannonii]
MTMSVAHALLSIALGLIEAPATVPAAGAPPAEAAHRPPANAALQYWQAFALMPAPDGDREGRLSRWNDDPLDGRALELASSFEGSRLYLLRGAALGACDWGLDYEDGIQLLLPHLGRARDLARMAALHARRELGQGRPEAAAEDAKAILSLARHVGSDPIAISILVRFAIEDVAIDLAASHLAELRPLAPGILSAYEALPPGATFERAFLTTEKEHTVRWLVRRMKEAEAKRPGSWRTVWKSVTDRPDGLEAINRVDSLDDAVRLTEDLVPLCDELAALSALPPAEFDARYPDFRRRLKQDHPLAGYLLTTPDTVLAAQRRNRARIELLRAAVVVDRDGPAKLADIKDPFGPGPFAYRATDAGFELSSALLSAGKPVTLAVRRTGR